MSRLARALSATRFIGPLALPQLDGELESGLPESADQIAKILERPFVGPEAGRKLGHERAELARLGQRLQAPDELVEAVKRKFSGTLAAQPRAASGLGGR